MMRSIVTFFFLFVFSSYLFAKSDYVGSQACASCHLKESRAWLGSHHQQAMAPATKENVLGDFDQVEFQHFGERTQFYRRGDEYWVNSVGPEGNQADYPIAYILGVFPLQQYLIAFPDGRYQTLSVAWDSRPASEGGQRWFHLYSDEAIPHTDPLHWTATFQNWNSRCAACHTTGFSKNYSTELDSYRSEWAESGVGCESCHGAGQAHLDWARGGAIGSESLLRDLSTQAEWWLGEGDTAQRIDGKSRSEELDSCASCHSLRAEIGDPKLEESFFQSHQLSLIDPGLYDLDGQIREEVYVYGSFLQSKMYHKGVTCSNCHEPHSLNLKLEGNGVCLQCHRADAFDTAAHHRHKPGSSGAQCANCHMPETVYMVVDPRRDHSIRIPRPDLSVAFGTRNSCTDCHTDRDAEWALQQFEEWGVEPPTDHWVEQLVRGRTDSRGGAQYLHKLLRNSETPAVIRATVLQELSEKPDRDFVAIALAELSSDDPILRFGALRFIEGIVTPRERSLIEPLLKDPIKMVRLEAIKLVSRLSPAMPESTSDSALQSYRREYLEAIAWQADFPETQVQIGDFLAGYGDLSGAIQAYQRSLSQYPGYLPAMINMSDLYRLQGANGKAEVLLREAISRYPEEALPHHALGLLLIRSNKLAAAAASLKRASRLDETNSRFGYVYALALWELQKRAEAVAMLEGLSQRFPEDVVVQQALRTFRVELNSVR